MLEAAMAKPANAQPTLDVAHQAERYRNLIEQAADGIFLLNEEGLFQDVNERGLSLLGMRREEVLGTRLRALVYEEDLAAHLSDWKAVQQGQPFLGERRLKRKDGSLVTVEVSARRLSGGHIQGILRDISHRKQAELTLRQREERFRNLTAAAFEGIGISEDGKVVDVNDQLALMLGYTRGDHRPGCFSDGRAGIPRVGQRRHGRRPRGAV
jgi:PAS domain S-box-containing protein